MPRRTEGSRGIEMISEFIPYVPTTPRARTGRGPGRPSRPARTAANTTARPHRCHHRSIVTGSVYILYPKMASRELAAAAAALHSVLLLFGGRFGSTLEAPASRVAAFAHMSSMVASRWRLAVPALPTPKAEDEDMDDRSGVALETEALRASLPAPLVDDDCFAACIDLLLLPAGPPAARSSARAASSVRARVSRHSRVQKPILRYGRSKSGRSGG